MLLTQRKVPQIFDRLRMLPILGSNRSGLIEVVVRKGNAIGAFGLSFLLSVTIPSLVALFYYVVIASDEYVAEAHFTIRAGGENRSQITDILSSINASVNIAAASTTQDIYIVSDYIKSRSIIQDIGGKARLSELYARPEIDWVARLSPDSLEGIWKYWRKKVSAVIDTPSSVVTLSVRAYSPREAVDLANSILQHSEALVNDISDRMRLDALGRAEKEVKLAQERLNRARADLLEFRRQNNMIDPELTAKSVSENIAKLTRERINLDFSRNSVSGSVTSDSPTQKVLNAQIAALDEQIARLQGQLTGKIDNTLANQIAGFESLSLAVQFGERLYALSQSSYEKSRLDVERQQLYLVVIERPALPEKATYPRIFLDTALVAVTAFALWSMVALVVAWVRDHAGS